MEQVNIIGIDQAKRSFQLHGARADGSVAFRRKLSREKLLYFLAALPRCVVAMEACASAHHWGREIMQLGHDVRLVPPIYVKPFVKRQKNDAADAEAICEAAQRPTMRFVAVKGEEQQARAMLFHTRDLLVRQRTQTINALRGHLAEFGVVAPQGVAHVGRLASALEDPGSGLPGAVRALGGVLLGQIADLDAKIGGLEKELRACARQDEQVARLMTIPGIGPISAMALQAFAPPMESFRRGRDFSAWLGLVPRQHTTGGKPRLGRIRPTGARTFVMLRDVGGESRRVSLGPVSTMGIAEARKEGLARQAVPEPDRETAPKRAVPLLREFIEGEWKEAHFDRYKPSTRKGVHYLLSSRILPEFGSKKLDRMTGAQLSRWFDAFSRTAPGNANHALALLRQIMNFAVACGYIEKNPTQGIRPNRRPRLTRFLSREEIGRLHRVLDAQTGENNRQQADIIRLLLLTGCRKGEILRLRWSEVHRDALFLADSKTGARKVPLNSQARSILERQPRDASPLVFPSPRNPDRPYSDNLALCYRVRRKAGIEDVRLHDLRHTHASHAVMNGVPVPVVSRMLGHSNVRMTLRYAHLGDREIEGAAERIGRSVAAIMDMAG